ncbi:Isochorismatase-like protein [Diplogelasinospora grovesii]|uniref:Isochorismatase-like protein n=1 Tax=Diplogelasinospora grovesii TaxID=303347 RepID=A0AAN6S981_9PEZI|nr:Isochorismatase-like protein [Diplogelasinospora grovesii]
MAQRRFRNPAIFICDLQEKFRSAIFEFDKVVFTASKLLRASSVLQIPVFVTTQNRARLGDTVSELAPHLSRATVHEDVDKTRFSMWIPPITDHFPTLSPSTTTSEQRREVVIVGIEAHICVTQTALDLLSAGHAVYVLADGVSSCNREEVPVALDRLRAAGAHITTSESWLYECMGDADIPEFKGIVGLVKETGPKTKEALQGLLAYSAKI